MPTKTFLPLTGLLATGLAVAAAADVDTNGAPVMPEIVVTATIERPSLTSPSLTKAAAQKHEIPGGFTIKDAASMREGRAANFQDLLHGTAGVIASSENSVELTKVSIRGSGIESDDEPLGVQMLLDSISMNQGDGETIMEDMDVSTIKYAEIFRGADAFKYGALDLGGAINFVPFTGYDAAPLAFRVDAGSFGFLRAQASSGGVDGPFDYYASISGRYREGYRDHSRENTGLLFADFGDKLGADWENRVYLTLDRTDRQLPGAISKDTLQNNPTAAGDGAADLDFSKKWWYLRIADKLTYEKDGQRIDIGAYWWHRDLEEKGDFDPTDFEEGIQDYFSDNAGIILNSVTHTELFGWQDILTVGFSPMIEKELDHNWENLAGEKGATIAKDAELSINLPFYLENQFYLTEKLSLLGGVQLIYAERHFSDYFTTTTTGDQSRQQDFFGINPKLGLLYELNDKNQVFINYSRGWQPPSFDNMVDFNGGTGTSLAYTPLQPQKSWTLEIGTRGEAGRFEWDLSLYHSWIRDELLDLFDATGTDIGDVNVAKSYHQGIEAGLDIELWNSKVIGDSNGQSLKLNQTYTLNDFYFDNDPVYGNNRIAGLPVHVYQAELMYDSPKGFYFGPNVECNLSDYPVDQKNTLYADDYMLVGCKAGYVTMIGGHRFSVFFEAKNLTDKHYAATVDPQADAALTPDAEAFHPGDGRSFYGGVTWSW